MPALDFEATIGPMYEEVAKFVLTRTPLSYYDALNMVKTAFGPNRGTIEGMNARSSLIRFDVNVPLYDRMYRAREAAFKRKATNVAIQGKVTLKGYNELMEKLHNLPEGLVLRADARDWPGEYRIEPKWDRSDSMDAVAYALYAQGLRGGKSLMYKTYVEGDWDNLKGSELECIWFDEMTEYEEDKIMLDSRRLMNDKVWEASDCRRMKPAEMGNDHLVNAIVYLEKNAHKYKTDFDIRSTTVPDAELALGTAAGMVQFFLGYKPEKKDILEKLWKMNPTEWIKQTPIYRAMWAEAEKRELTTLVKIVIERHEAYNWR